MYNTGCHGDAANLARKMIDVFAHAETVVTPSGSCAAMIHDYYLDLLKDDPTYYERARQFINKTYEFTQFIKDVLKVDLANANCTWPGSVTYHYSCHLRGLGMTNEAVTLLQQIKELNFIPLDKSEQCCGFGGTFAVKYPEISGTMVRDKVACIANTKASTLVCNDGGCSMNITGALNREGVKIQTKHIAEIIAEGLGILPRTDTPAAEVTS